jgi:uncharacterized protein involved in response to NO
MRPRPATITMQNPASPQDPGADATGVKRRQPKYLAVFEYGFRPFFLLAGGHAALTLPLWIALLNGRSPLQTALPAFAWHAHEMLYGFVAAAVAGFLLTAVPSWTGRRGFAGAPLAGLVLLWLAGRLLMTLPLGLAPTWTAIIDLAFLPALALTILPALVRSGNRRNFVFIGLLALLFASNLQFHLHAAADSGTLRLGLNTMLLMVTMLGGRMIPAFTSAGLKQRGLEVRISRKHLLDRAVLLAVAGVLVVDLVDANGWLAAAIAASAALLLTLQLSRWQGPHTLAMPLLWVLQLAYAWLPVCLALKAAMLAGLPIPGNAWLHALTVGAMATMIIGVMSRAALGHTGRELVAPRGIAVAYLLLTGAALTRVFGPILYPPAVLDWYSLSALLWCLAFTLFVIVYAPILCRPRVDGRPG